MPEAGPTTAIFPRSANANAGFTLIELVTVILIGSILAVYASSRLFTSSGYQEYTYQDRLITALRRLQTNAMNQTDVNCHQFWVEQKQAGVPDQNACSALPSFSSGYWDDYRANYRGARITDSALTYGFFNVNGVGLALPGDIRFDSWGRPLAECSGGCQIAVTGDLEVKVCIEPEGYVHEC